MKQLLSLRGRYDQLIYTQYQRIMIFFQGEIEQPSEQGIVIHPKKNPQQLLGKLSFVNQFFCSSDYNVYRDSSHSYARLIKVIVSWAGRLQELFVRFYVV